MSTLLLMCGLVLSFALCACVGARPDEGKRGFLSLNDSIFLRGFWCIVVVLVHTPEAYQNPIQDMIGSFAYVGVTFFFLTSAFGLRTKIARQTSYLPRFWRTRLPALLVPALLANVFTVFAKGLQGDGTALSYVDIDAWVKALLFLYAAFWCVYRVLPKYVKYLAGGGITLDVVFVLFVLASSLLQRCVDVPLLPGWYVERWGFAYGIILARHADEAEAWLSRNRRVKTFILMAVSAILGVGYLRYKPVPFWGDYCLKLVLGMAILAFMFAVLVKLRVGNRAIFFIGSVSYEVYLLHRGVFALLAAVCGSALSSGAYIVLSLLLTILLAPVLKEITKGLLKGLDGITRRIQTLQSGASPR